MWPIDTLAGGEITIGLRQVDERDVTLVEQIGQVRQAWNGSVQNVNDRLQRRRHLLHFGPPGFDDIGENLPES